MTLDLHGKHILVTGAAGFIGSNLVDELLQLGANVIGIDNLFNGRVENLKSATQHSEFKFIKGDIRDFDFMLHIMKDVDIIFHKAAFTSVPQSVFMPQLCNDVNISGTLNILNAARILDTKKLVFASSSSVYGDTPTLPKHEQMKLDPISPYGVSKVAAEAYMVSYHRVYGLNTTALRYFNVFGPRQKDSSYSGVIAIFLGQILRNENPVVFGDGLQSRDFTYVQDVISANLLAVSIPESAGRVFNIAAGHPITINDLAQLMINLVGKPHLHIQHVSPRMGDILHSFGDIRAAQAILGFSPRYTVESGLREYIKQSPNGS